MFNCPDWQGGKVGIGERDGVFYLLAPSRKIRSVEEFPNYIQAAMAQEAAEQSMSNFKWERVDE
jgi:hypothetical protein